MKGGVLIIGSLYWDIDQGKYLNVRKNWRDNHLQMNNRLHVKSPIRYGRTSGLKEKVYTMAFSHSAETASLLGTTFVVPFKLDISNYGDLYQQAKYLSEAEGAQNINIVKRSNGDVWCVIGILFNPNFDAQKKQVILDRFQQQLDLEEMGNVYQEFCIPNENSILSGQGEILINWPSTVNAKNQLFLDGLDFILATCPKQNLTAYPEAAAIKALAINDKRNYFYNNVASGITTYQDREIVEA